MAFTKTEMQQELMAFMQGFVQSVKRQYGNALSPNNDSLADVFVRLSDEKLIRQSWLWRGVNEMYDYGIAGIPIEKLGESTLDGFYADTEMFLRGLDSLEMYLLEADDV